MSNTKTHYFLLITLTLISLTACTSPKEEKTAGEEKAPLVPIGMEIIDTDTLQIQKEIFVINALKYIDEDSLADINPELIRPLTILKKAAGEEYELMARNDSVILCKECGGIWGDPWEDLQIEENSFVIYHMGGSSSRWTRNIKFQYNQEKKSWFLSSDRGVSFSTLDPEGSFNETMYTEGDSLGLVPFEKFKTAF